MVAVSTTKAIEAVRVAGLIAVEVESTDAAMTERITLALIEAVANDHLSAGDRVVVVYPGFESDTLDSVTVVRLGEHLERLSSRDLRALETSVPFETLKAVVDVGVEIGREGREGKSVGTLIVVGDVRNVMARSRTLGFDPFKGYRRKERNLRDLKVREAIKEIAQMDGAFVVARDGTVEAACRIIDAPNTGLTLPKGLGTRHWAAAAITNVTHALAVVVSQSTGTVRLFQQGEIILRIAPMRHYRALKWHDTESEPAQAKAEKDGAR
jgi:DNA integrity scanning protein DisA with diadenylate cyclase activity